MFYSHEVLTSRKYGVATVWLVATLGSKSTLKKLSRKAILDVDVQKACETIVTPEAPMALRLQSNLLYGVTRVYAQQCGYVLTDVEQARNGMRALLRVMRGGGNAHEEEEGALKGRTEQLVMQDDPNFLPDVGLAPMEMERMDFETTMAEGSQRSTLSPHSSQQVASRVGSQQEIGGLVIPQSASSFVGGPAGGFGGLSVHGSAQGDNEDVMLFDDDLGLIVGDDGALMEDLPLRQGSAVPSRGARTEVSGVSSKLRRDETAGPQGNEALGQPDDDGFMPLQDDDVFGLQPQADTQGLPSQAEPDAQQQQQETSEETAAAPQRRRNRPGQKAISLDSTMELHNSELARWNTDYVANMEQALRHKNAGKAVAQAKKNAEFWMLGQSDAGPLSLFQGAQLLEALTGINLSEGGRKRPRDEGYETDERRRKRSRGEEPSSDEIGRGLADDDGYMVTAGDDTIEQGREAPTPLDDRQLSSLMPWNQSAGSRRPTALFTGTGQQPTSASMGPGGMPLNFPARRGSRLTSASPLLGRGTAPVPSGDLDDFQLPGSGLGDIGMSAVDTDDFELYGAAANVDTQTAAQSQWQRAALNGESLNFLDFVKTGIEEADKVRADITMGDEEDETLQGSVDFETLLRPESNTCVVAAQALLHVLSLGTKGLLSVGQEESFGAITLRPVGAAI